MTRCCLIISGFVSRLYLSECRGNMQFIAFVLLLGAVYVQSKDEEQKLRSREQIDETLTNQQSLGTSLHSVLDELEKIHENTIKPLEKAYRYNDLSAKSELDAGQLKAKPMVLFLGPWSTGKTTMINYLLDTDILRVGAEPTTSEFTIVTYGKKKGKTKGSVLMSDKTTEFAALEKFGENFIEKFSRIELPHSLLKSLTLVDTPGIIENRKQQQRGYPFYEVIQWFIDNADLIFLVFDPTKLDVGSELETLFKQLKGKESQIRLILNKADNHRPQELMRVYGALFWSLAPLLRVVEPPRVYVSSFWPYEYKPSFITELFKEEELSLLEDLNEIMENRLENKLADVRVHARRVLIHALIVNEYLEAYYAKKSLFQSTDSVVRELLDNAESYGIFKNVWSRYDISRHDTPSSLMYRDFFSRNKLLDFKPLKYQCGWFGSCEADKLEETIEETLPKLLKKVESESSIRDEL